MTRNKDKRVLTVEAPSKTYEITIGSKWIDSDVLKALFGNRRVVIITDHQIYELYKTILDDFDVYIIEAGEASKSLENYSAIQRHIISKKLNRSDAIVAFGGGVVGDLAGFVAATYMRGIGFIQVPTTLLSMVDSSVGGKVAVNHETGKNILGSFYQPDAVYMDIEFLKTLPDEEFSCGMAEVIKYGLIWDETFFSLLKDRNYVINNIEEVIETCCKIKAEIVSKDEEDHGLRQILNFGHTLGHAIESFYHYNRYKHGQGVAIGMSIKSKLAMDRKDIDEETYLTIIEVMKSYNLPIEIEEKADLDLILKEMVYDKKADGKDFKLIELTKVGNVSIKTYSFEVLMEIFK